MTDAETYGCRQLWTSVVLSVLKDHRARIAAARRGKQARIDGRHVGLAREDAEIAYARRYLESADFHTVCELAGLGLPTERVVAWVCGDAEGVEAAAITEWERRRERRAA